MASGPRREDCVSSKEDKLTGFETLTSDNASDVQEECKAGEPFSSDSLTLGREEWRKSKHDSNDLDEKFTSMTGSYSEIMDKSQEESISTPGNLNQESCDIEEESEEMRVKQLFHKDSIARFMKDFTDKSSISSHSSKCREGHSRSHKYVPTTASSSGYPSCPPVDPSLLGDLEDHARKLASSMDTLIEGLTGTLHSISALSVDCMETYRDAVCKTCDALDSNIKSMYQLMAKCEELNKSMKSVYKLHDQIKEVKRLLDLFENVVFSGGT